MTNGLGLGEFIGKEENPSTEEVPSTEVKEEITEPEHKEVPEVTETPSTEVPEVKTATPVTETPETPETPSVNWDSEDNPFAKKASESDEALKKMEKRYHDTQTWANNLNQSNLDLKKQMEVLGQKIDGTYDENAVDPQAEQNVQFQRDYEAKYNVSKATAVDQYGEDHLNQKLFFADAPFQKIGQDPISIARVQLSDRPVYEALRIVEEHEFFDKYGKDFGAIVDNVKKEIEPQIREEITKEFNQKIAQKNEQPNNLTNINSANVNTKDNDAPASKPLKQLFGGR